MKKIDKDKTIEPTKEELEQTKKMLKDKYDLVVPKPDLIRLVNLIKELEPWLRSDKASTSPTKISEEMAIEFKDLLKSARGVDISVTEAYEEARGLFVITAYKEKERISKEMRAIMVTHTQITRNTDVEDKILKLFKLHYDVELTENQIGQVAQYLTRVLWYEKGFDESLEKALNDLISYADKRKRGKKVNGLNLHNELRKALDETMGRLNTPNLGWERLYRKND